MDISTIRNAQKVNQNEDAPRQRRRERLHFYLNELGMDADLLEDAAFRSVTTTGD